MTNTLAGCANWEGVTENWVGFQIKVIKIDLCSCWPRCQPAPEFFLPWRRSVWLSTNRREQCGCLFRRWPPCIRRWSFPWPTFWRFRRRSTDNRGTRRTWKEDIFFKLLFKKWNEWLSSWWQGLKSFERASCKGVSKVATECQHQWSNMSNMMGRNL